MEIKKGDRFRCINDHKIRNFYTYGKIYSSNEDNCIVDDNGSDHYWGDLKDLEGNICFEPVTYSPTSPSHYKAYDIEAIEMMIRIWGKEEAAIFCKLSAFGYRLRMGMKDDVSIELGKEKWFLNKWKELRDDVTG